MVTRGSKESVSFTYVFNNGSFFVEIIIRREYIFIEFTDTFSHVEHIHDIVVFIRMIIFFVHLYYHILQTNSQQCKTNG